jgi:uncharacterized protein YdeI (YjbR/CyaY-like superfamily)
MASVDDAPILPFASAMVWEEWLIEHHARADAVWLKVAKKASGVPSVTHDEALDVALCYGWIDGLRRGLDGEYFLQRFTPRRPRSNWSKRNTDKIAHLMAANRMQPAGLAEVESARRDGRWEAALA